MPRRATFRQGSRSQAFRSSRRRSMVHEPKIFSLIVSLALHGIILGVGMMGLSTHTPPEPLTLPPPCSIPLEIQEIAEVSSAPISQSKLEDPASQEVKRVEDPVEIPQEIPPQSIPPKKSLPELIPKPEPQLSDKTTTTSDISDTKPLAAPPDEVPLVEADKEISPVPPPTPPKKQERKKPSIKKPEPSPKPVKKNPKVVKKGTANQGTDEEDFLKILKDVDDSKKGPSAQTPVTDKASTSRFGAAKVGPKMALSVTDRVRRLLENAWRVPLRAHEKGKLRVVVRLSLRQDGTVSKAEVLDSQGTPTHPAYAMGVKNALQAVYDPQCNPLPLPPEHYDQWRVFTFRFSPR